MKYLTLYAGPNTHRKARSKRGWTSPTPKEIARQQAAQREKERIEAKNVVRQANAAKHQEWLYAQAKSMPEAARFDWIAEHAHSASETTMLMDRLARGD